MQTLIAQLSEDLAVMFDPELSGEGCGLSDGVVMLKGSQHLDTVLPVQFRLVSSQDTVPAITADQVLTAVQTALKEAEFQLIAHSVRFATR